MGLLCDRDVAVADVRDVVLEFGPAVRFQYLVPSRRFLVPAEVGLEFACEDANGGRLPDPVRTEDTSDLALLWSGKPVQREGVLAVAVDGLVLELLREINDLNSIEGALLDADSAGFA